MSEATRVAALAHAATIHASSADAESTLATADAFHDFITQDNDKASAPAKAAAPAKKAAAAPVKPAAPAKKKAVPVVEDDAEDEDETEAGDSEAEEGDVSKEDVASAIEALLNANLRPQTVKLMAKYKAKGVSQLKASDYAAFKQDADDLLMSA